MGRGVLGRLGILLVAMVDTGTGYPDITASDGVYTGYLASLAPSSYQALLPSPVVGEVAGHRQTVGPRGRGQPQLVDGQRARAPQR